MSWSKILLVVIGLPVAGVMLFVAWVFVSFSGGLDDVLDFDRPSRTDPDVLAAEKQARGHDLPVVAAEVRSAIGEGAPGASEVGGGTAAPLCDVGQHNFKIDDDFDLSCTATLLSVVAAPVADEGGTATRVDAALRSDGWVPVPRPHDRGGPTVTVGRDQSPYRYTRTRDGQAWQLVIDEADLSSMTYELQALDGLHDSEGGPVAVEDLVAATPRDGYAVAVGVSVEYFRD